MAQQPPEETDQPFDSATTDPFNVSEFTRWAAEVERLAQAGIQQELSADLAAGRSIYFGEAGTDKVFQRLPNGQVFEICVREDGSVEIVRRVS